MIIGGVLLSRLEINLEMDGICRIKKETIWCVVGKWQQGMDLNIVEVFYSGVFTSTRSLPSKVGKEKRIAVKVIDHRGNEVMVVREMG
jgi:hypothetical protein